MKRSIVPYLRNTLIRKAKFSPAWYVALSQGRFLSIWGEQRQYYPPPSRYIMKDTVLGSGLRFAS